jgi:lincosamide nucleotidyltransferase A/C/D/E
VIARLYRFIARTALAPLLRSRPVALLKRRIVAMPADVVPEVMKALEQGGVRAWVAGGWGVDALIGRQTRRHVDLDLVFEESAEAERRTLAALEPLGFSLVRREAVPGRIWSERIVVSGRRARVIDLHSVAISNRAVTVASIDGEVTFSEGEAFGTGVIEGRTVPCVSARLQLALHRGYEHGEHDRRDVERLSEQLGLGT